MRRLRCVVTAHLPRLLYALAGDGVMAHPKLEAEAAEMHAVPLFGDFTQESHCVSCGSVKVLRKADELVNIDWAALLNNE